MADLRVLAGLRFETLAVAEDAEERPRTRGRDEHQRTEGDEREPATRSREGPLGDRHGDAPTPTSAATPTTPGRPKADVNGPKRESASIEAMPPISPPMCPPTEMPENVNEKTRLSAISVTPGR